MKKLNKGVVFILPHLFLLLKSMILSIIRKKIKNIKKSIDILVQVWYYRSTSKEGGDKMKIKFIIVIGSWQFSITITKKDK